MSALLTIQPAVTIAPPVAPPTPDAIAVVLNLGPQRRQDVGHQAHVADVRDIFEPDLFAGIN